MDPITKTDGRAKPGHPPLTPLQEIELQQRYVMHAQNGTLGVLAAFLGVDKAVMSRRASELGLTAAAGPRKPFRTGRQASFRRKDDDGKPKMSQQGWREIGGKRIYCRSAWEANYARYLQWLLERGEIEAWEHEPQTYWFKTIQRGVRSYLPDFGVTEKGGRYELHEVKGYLDQKSRTKLKRMAKYYPEVPVKVIAGKTYRLISRQIGRLIQGWEIVT